MRRFNQLAVTLTLGGTLTAGCSSTPERPIVYPHAGIVLEKKSESYIKCFDNSDIENVGGCSELQSSRRYIYHITIGACVGGSTVTLASDEYLRGAAQDASKYPITKDGLAAQQPGMDSNRDYACAQTFEISSKEAFDKIAEKSYYTE